MCCFAIFIDIKVDIIMVQRLIRWPTLAVEERILQMQLPCEGRGYNSKSAEAD